MEPSGGESQDVRSTTVETAVVFRCITCGEILSDSSEVVAACDSLGVVACAGLAGAVLRENLLEAEVPFHSAYAEIACSKCSEVVGRQFRDLPYTHTLLKDYFCLDCDRIDSFALGTCSLRARDSRGLGSVRLQLSESSSQEDLQARVIQLEADLTDVQRILLLHSEQLEHLTKPGGINGVSRRMKAPPANDFGNTSVLETPNLQSSTESATEMVSSQL